MSEKLIPTPETDANVRKLTKAPDCFCESDFARDLERRLAVARGFINELTTYGGKYPHANGTKIVVDAYAILAAIAPKP